MASGCVYTDEEILTFIAVVEDTESYKMIDGRKHKNKEIFEMLARKTNERHPDGVQKNGEQWRTKWKKLKSTYSEERLKASKSGLCYISLWLQSNF